MNPFLKLVAEDLHDKLQGDFTHTAVVFPNKRAGLFFNEYLATRAGQPVWSPAYLTISELFRSLTDRRVGDPIELVCRLYEVFRDATRSHETLDEFYFWGELLISDFDDIDKNRVDADRLFANLQDLKAYDTLDFLNDEQADAIRQFFRNFSVSKTTELKQRFIALWNVLGDIYHRFRDDLAAQNIAYEGMLYREACEALDASTLPYEHYVFVGFNVLNRVEHLLFEKLQAAGKALFYWDYDVSYLDTPNHEAGEFIRRNLRDFPSELPESHFHAFAGHKEIEYVAASTENAQARFLPDWLRAHLGKKESETAVVLCNEALLQPVFHSLPSDTVRHVNITMGFPLAQTPVYSLINALVSLQTEGYHADTGRYDYAAVIAVLKHPYVRSLSPEAEPLGRSLTARNRFYPLPSELQTDELLTHLFTPVSGNAALCTYLEAALERTASLYRQETAAPNPFDQLYRESLFQAYTTVNRFRRLIEGGTLRVQTPTLARLMNKVFSTASIPFHGEPAIGLQVMGVLETRNLDFRNVVMLSLNEGKLPKGSSDSSFIPYNLRKAFGMTLLEHKNAVYAYYFYRLMQRAEHVALLYNTSSDGLNRGEMSRFMLQLLTESNHDIRKSSVTAGQMPMSTAPIRVDKTPEVLERLYRRFHTGEKGFISPSALNTYLDCRLKFYFHYIAGLRPKEEVSAEIDSATFGSIFHRSAELVYRELTAHGDTVRREDLEPLLRDKVRLEYFVDSAFKELFFHVRPEDKPEYNGVQLLNSEVIVSYLRQLLEKDLYHAPFRMVAMELPVHEDFTLSTPTGTHTVRIGGIIDRLDSKDGTLRIVDYKTGGEPSVASSIEMLFTPTERRPNYVLQTFLYAAIMTHRQPLPVAPALLYIHKAASADYSPVIRIGEPYKEKKEVTDFREYDEEFRARLRELLEEIFHPSVPFTQTDFDTHCAYCDFKDLCRR